MYGSVCRERKGSGGFVRPMRIVQVHPQEEWRASDASQPVDGFGHHFVAAPLAPARAFGLRCRRRAVDVEALAQSAIGIEHAGRDERGSSVSRESEDLGHRGHGRGQRRIGVVPNAVARRQQSVNSVECEGSVSGDALMA